MPTISAVEPTSRAVRDMLTADPLDLGRESLLAAVEESRACLRAAWPSGHPALRALTNLNERLQDSRLHLAVLGQFKRGKSTFINALLGTSLLPSAVVPATAIPTFIAWAATLLIRVTYQHKSPAEEFHPADASEVREHLFQLVTEDGNPVNRLGIARVDLFLPAEILRDGIVLIDTPGIGSTLQHNTDTALEVLPECDAALFVVSADPPITQAETTYLAKVQGHVVKLFFVLNKIDYLSQQEQADALAFLRRALQRSGSTGIERPIFLLSARQALAASECRDSAALEASGLKRIEREILHALACEKVATLQASACAKIATILDQVLPDLVLQTRALELPLEDLEQRSQSLQEALRATEGERRVAHDLLEGDRRRAVAELESQAERLRQDGGRHFTGVVQRVIEESGGVLDRSALQQALEAAVPVFFEHRLAAVAAVFRESVEAMLARHQARADALIASVRQTAATLFDLPLRAEEATEPFRLGPEPYWVTQGWSNVLMPSPASLLARIVPGKLRRTRLCRQVAAQVGALVQHNVENLRWTTLRGVNETFRRFSAQLDERLTDVLAVTEGVIGVALERRRTEEGQVAAELERLYALAQQLGRLREQFAPAGGT